MSDMNINVLGLYPRTYNILIAAGYDTVSRLTKLTFIDLLKMPNMGKKSAKDVESRLEVHGECLSGGSLKASDFLSPEFIISGLKDRIDYLEQRETLHDKFMMAALTGMIASPHTQNMPPKLLSKVAHELADACMKVRSAPK